MEKIYGIHTIKSTLKLRPKSINTLYVSEQRADVRLLELVEMAASAGITVAPVSSTALDALLPKQSRHQGVVADLSSVPQFTEKDIDEFLTAYDDLRVLVLDGVQDPHNLGACLRSANAFGVDLVIAPKDRAVGLNPTVRKVACGAAELTPFIPVTNLARTMRLMQSAGVWFVGTADDAVDPIHGLSLTGSVGLVMGAEGKGVRRLTRSHCDYLVHIPMQGAVECLNVSVATGICLFSLFHA